MTPPPPDIALARAREALVEARQLRDGAHLASAVSKAYYAAFYACLAILATVGLEPKTHDGVRTLVNLHFVKSGKLPPETSQVLAELEGARTTADYDLGAVFTHSGVERSITLAERFVDDVASVVGDA